jgi:transcriptional regulator with XRE-family HTH domain
MPASQRTLNLADLGRRVRAARLARRLTLEDVVAHTGLTVSWLSKLENGLLAPSLEGLVRLAQALECGVDALVEGLSVPPTFVVDKPGDGTRRPARGRNGLVAEPLADGWHDRRMRPAILHVSGNGNRHAPEHHDGERFLLVLEGEVRVIYGGEQITLGRGESIYLRATVPHAICPTGSRAARVLSVSYDAAADGTAGRVATGVSRPRGSSGSAKSTAKTPGRANGRT